jgi:hypothetical protein
MKVIEWLKETYKDERHNVRPMAICADGFKISIQGGTTSHYCFPRRDCNEYDKVELGYPSQAELALVEWAEDESNLTETVYGYVPIGVIEAVVAKHGGIDTSSFKG